MTSMRGTVTSIRIIFPSNAGIFLKIVYKTFPATCFARHSGIHSRTARFGYMVLFGSLKTTAVILAAPRLDTWGRRPMLLSSLSVMTVGLTLISINLYANSSIPLLAIFGVIIYYVGFSIGVGPACWLIPSEIFPNIVRAKVGVSELRRTSHGFNQDL